MRNARNVTLVKLINKKNQDFYFEYNSCLEKCSSLVMFHDEEAKTCVTSCPTGLLQYYDDKEEKRSCVSSCLDT